MKRRLLLVSLLVSIKSFAQLYIGGNAPVYVKNEVLYVTKDINIAANSTLYLRNNSQVLQGTSGSSSNSGTGVLSLYQEGTSDNFDYNYWCSPIGNNVASLGNTNFGITLLFQPTTSTLSTSAAILPIGSYNGSASPLTIASNWIYKLINANNYSQWVQVGNTTNIAPGEGFTMKGTSGIDNTDPEGTGIVNNPGTGAQRYDFRGRPNDGNISVSVGSNNAATLTGNPYPSALHLNAFLLDPANTAATGIAYFWQQDKNVNSHFLSAYRGGYAAYSPISLGSSGVYAPATFKSYNSDGTVNANPPVGISPVVQRKYIPIGQGFLINGATNGSVTFKNIHRIYYKEGNTFSQFEKPGKNKNSKIEEVQAVSYFRLNTIINEEFTRQLALAFVADATDGVDHGIDAKNMDESLPNDISFWIENKNYVIQGITFDPAKKVSLAVKANVNTKLKFQISEVVNFDSSQSIYLYDSLDMSYHDIKNATYEVNVAPGNYNERFKISFTDKTLGLEDQNKTDFFISQNNQEQLLSAVNPNNIIMKSFVLYDIMGRAVLTKNNLAVENVYNFSTMGLSSGIYIAAFLTEGDIKFNQKIIISRSEM